MSDELARRGARLEAMKRRMIQQVAERNLAVVVGRARQARRARLEAARAGRPNLIHRTRRL